MFNTKSNYNDGRNFHIREKHPGSYVKFCNKVFIVITSVNTGSSGVVRGWNCTEGLKLSK